jgi:hypothetical protein
MLNTRATSNSSPTIAAEQMFPILCDIHVLTNVVVTREGRIVEQFQFENSAQRWCQFRERIASYLPVWSHSYMGTTAGAGSWPLPRYPRIRVRKTLINAVPGPELAVLCNEDLSFVATLREWSRNL